jgi:hypothetical protein
MTPGEIETLRTEYRARLLRGDWVGGPLTEMKIDIMIKEEERRRADLASSIEEGRQRLLARESDESIAKSIEQRIHCPFIISAFQQKVTEDQSEQLKSEFERSRIEHRDECAAIALKRQHQIKLVKLAIGAALALGALLTFATMDFNASPERAIQTAK